ncbi:hypothetical protein Pla144_06260 [Bythopirellula polymerisocia]|uniref:Uncharacterized protein n=1 Tax=Bythopirellula polymerisocia TaxID=2528003 RepID=A0A5C6D3P4_9BACT|nr:hypothetical protein Pla144_06260 [Bythopirellula polymerisocia]
MNTEVRPRVFTEPNQQRARRVLFCKTPLYLSCRGARNSQATNELKQFGPAAREGVF